MPHPTFAKLARAVRGRTAAATRPGESDRELLTRYARDKDEAAFEALVRRHGRAVLAACRHVLSDPADVDDAFQATFLVLLKKAQSADWQDSLGGWLYAVAHRVAVSARANARRRQTREQAAAGRAATEAGPPDLSWREAVGVLHEELNRLPAKYRLPLLLCYLDGRSRDEAAADLGWSPGAVKGCLERGRDLLATRLGRRGITLSAGLLAVLAGGSGAAGGPPPGLVELTVRAACGGASPAVAALVRGASPMALAVKTKLTAAVVLAVGLVGGLAGRPAGADTPAPPAKEAMPAVGAMPAARANADRPPAGRTAPGTRTVTGRFVGPDGKPVAGADVSVQGLDAEGPGRAGSTDADGRFTVTVPAGKKWLTVIARRDGVGLDFADLDKVRPGETVALRVGKDRPIRGRVVSAEGKPVAGAEVRVTHILAFAGESADGMLTHWLKRMPYEGLPAAEKALWGGLGDRPVTRTDADGRFTLAGFGAERFVGLRVNGAGIAEAEASVITRDGFDPGPYNAAAAANAARSFGRPMWTLSGPDPTVVVEHEKPVRGTVTDAATGKPVAGVKVLLSRYNDTLSLLPRNLPAVTDAAGRYEIRGAKKARRYMVEIAADPDAGTLGSVAWAEDTDGYGPASTDLRLARGVIIRGRLIDKGTGKPVPGFATVATLRDNPFAKTYPPAEGGASGNGFHTTKEDGTFRLVSLPGPVILMGGPANQTDANGLWLRLAYTPPAPDPKYPDYFFNQRGWGVGYYMLGGGMSPLQGNFCRVLDLKPDAGEVTYDIELEPAVPVRVAVRDPDGRPVADAWYTGASPEEWHAPTRYKGDDFPAYHILPGKSRRMAFYEPTRKLVGSMTIKAGDSLPPEVKLGPPGRVTGRLVGPDGKPLAGVRVSVRHTDRSTEEIQKLIHDQTVVETDADGRFAIADVIPGLPFQLDGARGRLRFDPPKGSAKKTFTTTAGGTADLGDLTRITIEPREE